MEDLKDFTGAGLNLTIFNALDAKKVLQGIRDVWASPYAERSYKWRQRYLLNPENVYPSILIIPSVNADCSGVLITKGITTGNEMENAIAFNRGVGGAVDGQAAESWILASDTTFQLVTPARELRYLTIPATGGSVRLPSNLEGRILSPDNLLSLQQFATQIRDILPNMPGIETNGPFDVELGFQDNKIWLFQVRPFVESKQAASSDYLLQITPKLDEERLISLKLNTTR
jgi:phosphoenolpyruvate synthase/pyruvate phosphate dikinase